MSERLPLNVSFLVGIIVGLAFVIVYPLALAVLAHRRLRVGWRYFAYGAVIFFVVQLVTGVPAAQVIRAAISGQLKASPMLTWSWLVVLA